MSEPLIVIDPGHGGADPGAVSISGNREADICLDICKRIARRIRIRPGLSAALTHAGEGLGLSDRADYANERRAVAFVSIHCNSFTSRLPRGTEVWTSPGITGADSLAAWILGAVQRKLPRQPIRTDTSDGDVDKEARFRVLMRTRMPAVLVETAFLSNPADETNLMSSVWRSRFASATVEGILGWLNERPV